MTNLKEDRKDTDCRHEKFEATPANGVERCVQCGSLFSTALANKILWDNNANKADCHEELWQPIGTAPKDGTWILLYDPEKNVAVGGCWHTEEEINNSNAYEPGWSWWTSDEDYVMWDDGNEPTHWMPLPAAPLARATNHQEG